jgi:hypothetical protein
MLLPAISRRERPRLFRGIWNVSDRERRKPSQDRRSYSDILEEGLGRCVTPVIFFMPSIRRMT